MTKHVFSTILGGDRWNFRLFAPEDGTGAGGTETGEASADASQTDAGSTQSEGEGNTSDGKTGEAGFTPGAGTAIGGGEPGQQTEETSTQGDDAEQEGGQKEGEDATLDAVPEDGQYGVFEEMPEGLDISDDDKTFWEGQFKEMGLTKRQADQVKQLAVADRQRQEAVVMAAIDKQQQQHKSQLLADKEIGGDNWAATEKLVGRALDAMRGGPRQIFDGDGNLKNKDGVPPSAIENLILATGNGNHPEIMRELRRIGELFKSDTFAQGRPVDAPNTTETRWYGGTTPDKKRG